MKSFMVHRPNLEKQLTAEQLAYYDQMSPGRGNWQKITSDNPLYVWLQLKLNITAVWTSGPTKFIHVN